MREQIPTEPAAVQEQARGPERLVSPEGPLAWQQASGSSTDDGGATKLRRLAAASPSSAQRVLLRMQKQKGNFKLVLEQVPVDKWPVPTPDVITAITLIFNDGCSCSIPPRNGQSPIVFAPFRSGTPKFGVPSAFHSSRWTRVWRFGS